MVNREYNSNVRYILSQLPIGKPSRLTEKDVRERRAERINILFREAGKRENGYFRQSFACYFLHEHIPGVVVQTGRIGGENGGAEEQK